MVALGRWPKVLLPMLLGLAALPALAQERPLPNLDLFVAQVRSHLRTDRQLLSQYTFRERQSDVHLSTLGKLTTGPAKVYEVYPSVEPDDTYRRLIEVDGKPRDPADLEKDDRRHQQQVLEAVARRERESAADRQKRLGREAKARAEDGDTLDDLLRVYQFRMAGRQALDGHQVIVLDFVPKPNAAPKTDDGKSLTSFKGRAWIGENDYELVRVDVEVLKDFPLRWFLGRLYKGTTASYVRRKINDEVWLPSELRVNASGRALIRKFHLETVTQYFDYRKFSITTDSQFSAPARDGR